MLLGGKRANRMNKMLGLVDEGESAAAADTAAGTPSSPGTQDISSTEREEDTKTQGQSGEEPQSRLQGQAQGQTQGESQGHPQDQSPTQSLPEPQEQLQGELQELSREKTPEHPQDPSQQSSSNELTPPPTNNTLRVPRAPSRYSSRGRVSTRVLSADEMMLSQKVRSMYRHGNEGAADWNDLEEERGSIHTSTLR